MSSLHELVPVQLRERYFDQEAGDTTSGTSVRSRGNSFYLHGLYLS